MKIIIVIVLILLALLMWGESDPCTHNGTCPGMVPITAGR